MYNLIIKFNFNAISFINFNTNNNNFNCSMYLVIPNLIILNKTFL